MDQDGLWVLIPVLFLVIFSVLWLGITSLLGVIAGWYRLQRAFPDHGEPATERLRYRSGAMGRGIPVNFGSCLTLDICATGLRVSVLRVLGPFHKPFFVPWSSIEVRRKGLLLRGVYELSFGMPVVSKLMLADKTLRQIVAASPLEMPDK